MTPTQYVEQMEEISVQLLNELNSGTGWFKEIKRLDTKSPIDFTARDTKNRIFAIEVKLRYCDLFKYETIFLNPEKYNALKAAGKAGFIPLYINFFQCSDTFIAWDMRNTEPVNITEEVVPNTARNCTELVTKYHLAIRQGLCFQRNIETGKYERRW